MSDQTTKETHPSYVLASFHRICGGLGRLFGSPLPNHNEAVQLSIRRCEVERKYATEFRFGRDEIIEVRFSAAQFAELLTTMNRGEGVPGTLTHLQGAGKIPGPPENTPLNHQQVITDFKDKVQELSGKLHTSLNEVELLLEKKGALTKEEKTKVRSALVRACQDVDSNFPYLVEIFGEAAVDVVTAAKADIAAATTTMMARSGLAGVKAPEVRALDEGGE